MNAFMAWRRTAYFYSVDMSKLTPMDALPKGEHKVTAIHSGPPAEIAVMVERDGGDKISDWDMAQAVLYGDLFHFDADKALHLETLGAMTRAMYVKAAEVRCRTSCYYLRGEPWRSSTKDGKAGCVLALMAISLGKRWIGC